MHVISLHIHRRIHICICIIHKHIKCQYINISYMGHWRIRRTVRTGRTRITKFLVSGTEKGKRLLSVALKTFGFVQEKKDTKENLRKQKCEVFGCESIKSVICGRRMFLTRQRNKKKHSCGVPIYAHIHTCMHMCTCKVMRCRTYGIAWSNLHLAALHAHIVPSNSRTKLCV
jgi:hypothetical protein